MGYSKKNILQTIIYADIFDYALSYDELWKFLIATKPESKQSFNSVLAKYYQHFGKSGENYCLRGRESLFEQKKLREKESKKKYRVLQKTLKVVSFIPTVYCIGLTGGLSMNNVEANDDIDLCIITKKNTLWLTRLLVTILLDILGVRRKRIATHTANKICLNLFLDESALAWSPNQRDLLSAHEIVQMKPVFERNNIYTKFIMQNAWVTQFLPNSIDTEKITVLKHKNQKENNSDFVINIFLMVCDFFAKTVQLWYIRKHVTHEIVQNTMAAFYPYDRKEKILRKYEKMVKTYETL